KKEGNFEDFCTWIEEASLMIQGKRLLIMIDELSVVDEIWQHDRAISVVYRLKSFIEKFSNIAIILCTQASFFKQRVICSPLLRIGISVRLDHLDPRAAQKLVREPMGYMLKYDDQVV